MIYKSSSPLSPYVDITIDGVEINYRYINGAELILEENKHDLLLLKVTGIQPKLLLDYIDVPVTFSIDSGAGRSQVFIGYVANVEPSHKSTQGFVNNSALQEATITCVGASYYMKGTKSATWNPPTLSNVVNTFSKRYGFSTDYPQDTYVPNNLVQNTESDWSFLVRVSEKYGYKLSMHGTHLHIWDVAKALGRVASYHELVTVNNAVGAQPCTVLEFDGVFGSLSSSGGASSTSTSFVDNQGNTFVVSSRNSNKLNTLGKKLESPFDDFVSTSALSYEEAEREVLKREKDDMPFEASAKITAGAGIVPGGIVNLLNFNTDFDGFWYVRAVTHNVYQNHYVTNLRLSKDGVYDDFVKVPAVTKLKTPPGSSLIDKSWVASVRRVNAYV
jgi:hypothetical protein